MTMERISGIFILFLSASFSGKHASGFSLPSGDCSLPAAGRYRHHHHHDFNVNVNNNSNSNSNRGCSSRSTIQRMASTSGSSSSNGGRISELETTTTTTNNKNETILSKAPSLNGKIVLPVKVMAAGLRGHRVAAVYAILNSNYKRGSGEGWEHVVHVGVTKDLAQDIAHLTSQRGIEAVAHVRALSFSYPQKATMEDFANGWRYKVNNYIQAAERSQGGGGGGGGGEARMVGSNKDEDVLGWGMAPSVLDQDGNGRSRNMDTNNLVGNEIVADDDDDDDEDEDMDEDDLDDYLQMMAVSRAAVSSSPAAAAAATSTAYSSSPPPLFVDNTGLTNIVSLKNKNEMPNVVISPFESTNNAATKQPSTPTLNDDDDNCEILPLFELIIENVDKVLDEVRPYLISDGGNVCVQSVDTETGNIYLQLEGACGSCASSTVTMKMGIERVLREKFGDRLGEVIQVVESGGGEGGTGGGGKPSELTTEAVQAEVNRMSAAITAMGGVVRVVTVDPIGVVEIEFRGPNRVKKGIELALLDVEFVKHVKFVS